MEEDGSLIGAYSLQFSCAQEEQCPHSKDRVALHSLIRCKAAVTLGIETHGSMSFEV